MNNLEYLNQISQSSRPVSTKKTTSSKFPVALIAKIVGIGLAIFMVILLIGGIISNVNSRIPELTKQIYTRSINLDKTLKTYNKLLKSSRLRSIGSSLDAILTSSQNQLENYLESKYGKQATTPKNSILEEETTMTEKLERNLTNARLNGILDRMYKNQIEYQVSLLLSMCSELEARAKDDALLEIITQMDSNLTTIQESFETYSEIK